MHAPAASQPTPHIVILGGGYAGRIAAARLGMACPEARLTLVDAQGAFIERIRLHQRAAAGHPAALERDRELPGGATFFKGRATALDPAARTVTVDLGGAPRILEWDYLLYALGSRTDLGAVPGAEARALALDDPASADAVSALAGALAARGGRLAVVGGGLTGIEAAAELAEGRPGLRVALVTGGEVGEGLSARARQAVTRSLRRLGVEIKEGAPVAAVCAGELRLAGGEALPAEGVLWAGGLRAAPLAGASGLPVDERGRLRVGPTLQVEGHPRILALGDAARIEDRRGIPLGASCALAIPTGAHGAAVVAALLGGRAPRPLRFGYAVRCISLGRRDALVMGLAPDGSPGGWCLTGRPAAWVKEIVCLMAGRVAGWEGRAGIPLYWWPRSAAMGRALPEGRAAALAEVGR